MCLDGKLEPESNIYQASVIECATISIAISLKRIADELVGTEPSHTDKAGLIHNLWRIAEERLS